MDATQRPYVIEAKGDWWSSMSEDDLWKLLQEKVPEGTIISTPVKRKESQITQWEEDLARYQPLKKKK